MNSKTMTDDVRAEYENVPPFWFLSWSEFLRVSAGLVILGGFALLATIWFPPKLAKYSSLNVEQAYIASAVTALLSYLFWIATIFRHHNRFSLSRIWGAVVSIIGISFSFILGYEQATDTKLIARWLTSGLLLGVVIGYLVIDLIVKIREARK